jgi:hypothetical protein
MDSKTGNGSRKGPRRSDARHRSPTAHKHPIRPIATATHIRAMHTPPSQAFCLVERRHADGGWRLVAGTHMLSIDPDKRDEALWSLTGVVGPTMARKQQAVRTGRTLFFPLHFAPRSTRSLQADLVPLTTMQATPTGQWEGTIAWDLAIKAAADPRRHGTGVLYAILRQLERAAAAASTTCPQGFPRLDTAHAKIQAVADAASLLPWSPQTARAIVRSPTQPPATRPKR